MNSLIYAPHPFARSGFHTAIPQGLTIREVIGLVPSLPAWFDEHGEILINGKPCPREWWGRVKPRSDRTVMVEMRMRLHGGGSTGKNIATIIASVALIAVATWITAGGAAPFLGSAFAAGTFGATATAFAVTTVGALALRALVPPPATPKTPDQPRLGQASLSGNVIEPDGVFPRVLGKRKIFAPMATFPWIEIVLQDEVVEGTYALSGPHQWTDLRADGQKFNQIDGLEYETREGWDDDPPLSMIQRYGRMDTPQIELSEHQMQQDNGDRIENQSNPESDLPRWHGQVSRFDPDEIHLHALFPQGINVPDDLTTKIGVALRLRMRGLGQSGWLNLPEIHFRGNKTWPLKFYIKLFFGGPPIPVNPIANFPANNGPYVAFGNVPDQASLNPSDVGAWVADASFPLSGIRVSDRVQLNQDGVVFYLDTAAFSPGFKWEVQVMRSYTYNASDFNVTNYQLSGTVQALFAYKISGGLAVVAGDQLKRMGKCVWMRFGSLYNRYPIGRPGFALLAVRGTSINLQRISAIAAGYVQDRDAGEWGLWKTTSNPAPHFRDIAVGNIIDDAMSVDLLDDAAMVAWRTACIDNNWTCDLIIDGKDARDVLALIAACGRARWYMADLFSVVVDKDRTGEAEKQCFTPVNSNGFRFEKMFDKPIDGLILEWFDKAIDYDTGDPIIVYRDGVTPELAKLFETVTIEGKVEHDKVEDEGRFMLAVRDQRSAAYYLDADFESVISRNGDVVAIAHDVIEEHSRAARIVPDTFTEIAGLMTGMSLDAKVPVYDNTPIYDVADLFAHPDLFHLGEVTGIAIQLAHGGVLVKQLAGGTGAEVDIVTFETPFAQPPDLKDDRPVAVGRLGHEKGRYIIRDIGRGRDFTATLTLVDEAPEIHA